MALTGIFNSHLIMADGRSSGSAPRSRSALPAAHGDRRAARRRSASPSPTPAPTCRRSAPARVRDGDHYVVNGTKTWITNGIEGNCFALLVKTDPKAQPRHKGMSLFIAEKGPGFTRRRKLEKMGYKGIDSAELVFDDYRVPARQSDRRRRGPGLMQATGGLELGRINVAARGVGHRRRRARRVAALRAGAQDLRQADRRAPGDPAQARRDGDARSRRRGC